MTIWRLTLAQMRRSVSRLLAAGLAIGIATAFVAATVLVTSIVDQTARATVSDRYGAADLVVTAPMTESGQVSASQLASIRATPGVVGASTDSADGGRVSPAADPTRSAGLSVLSYDPGYPSTSERIFTSGDGPRTAGEIAIDSTTAERLDLGLGSEVQVMPPNGTSTYRATLVGIFRTSGPLGALALANPSDLAAHEAADVGYSRVYVVTDGSTAEVQRTLRDDRTLRVRTVAEQTDADLTEFLGDTRVLVGFVYGFVAVALVVAGLVIANTFQVLIATRIRTLALERCIGATRRQVRRSVLYEALVLGVAASISGIVLGSLLTQAALWILAPTSQVLLPELISPSAALFIAPLALGIGVTLVSALVPAQLAARVSPLQALQPAGVPQVAHGAGRSRLLAAIGLMVAGATAIVAALAMAEGDFRPSLLAAGALGGCLFVLGFLLAAVFWVPRLIGWLGHLFSRPGRDGSFAAMNAARNPRRTAATASALVIAVGLVLVVSTGAAVAQRSLRAEIESRFPIDLAVTAVPGDVGDPGGPPDSPPWPADEDGAEPASPAVQREVSAVLPDDFVADVMALPGVVSSVRATSTVVTESEVGTDFGTSQRSVLAFDPVALAEVTRGVFGTELNDGVALAADSRVSSDGAHVLLAGPGGTWTGTARELMGYGDRDSDFIVSANTMRMLDPQAPTTGLWLTLSSDADAAWLTEQIEDLAGVGTPDGLQISVNGTFEQRQQYDSVISTVLLVVLGLLAIAVVIALVGVANTLSLSVRERRRETAILRALGLTRKRLRRQLAIEGMLIAGVGALAGAVIGFVLGAVGAALLFTQLIHLVLTVPWQILIGILVISVGAGAIAATLPARFATRTPPTASLAAD